MQGSSNPLIPAFDEGDILIRIRLFGVFRSLSQHPTVTIAVSAPISVQDIKIKLASVLYAEGQMTRLQEAVWQASVLANASEIFAQDALITQSAELAILPPVCGG